MSPKKRTGGELIVDALAKSGVTHAFGIAGVHNLPIYDALYNSDHIESFVTRHEQGAAFMADGYARVTGKPGVALVTTGPGLTNTVTPICGAWSDSLPLLVIGTAGELPLLGKYKGYLHEYKDQHGVMDAAAGSRLLTDVASLERETLRALADIQTGRPRPLTLEVPIDVLAETAEVAPVEMPPLPAPPAPDAAAIKRTARLLRDAKYPIIMAGGGAARIEDATLLLKLAETLRAPVLTSISGKGAIPDSSLWAAGCTWRTSSGPADGYPDAWRKADAGIVIGSRLTGMSTRAWRLPLPETLAHLDLDPSEIGKSYPVVEPLVGDAGAGIRLLLDEIQRLGGDGASQWDPQEVRGARDADDAAGEQKCPEALEIVRQLRAGLPEDGILSCDQSIACYWAVRHFPTTGPRRFLYPAGSAALGFGLPVGIGAQIAAPDKQVVVLAGDGGFLFTGTELATAVQYDLPIAIIVCNDNAYGMIKAAQERRYNGRVIDTVLKNPDFVAYAKAFGAHAEKLTAPNEIADAIRAARTRNGPTLYQLDIALAPPFH
ncbi:MAG TPA: thiamine pyrophosphate-binding protein [Chloroflexota bacterium]|nr:thiamine pyrophosphate-binding protein [Chloroflexota bacterium]